MKTDHFNSASLPLGTKQLIEVLDQADISYEFRSFLAPANHAHEAASLLGCPLGAIVKSLAFQETEGKKLVLVLVSGKNRVDYARLEAVVGKSIRPAHPSDVPKLTGYTVGSVPPFAIKGHYDTLIDADLMLYDQVWAAAGSANILIGLHSHDLLKLSRGRVALIKQAEDSA